jgi:hypothetical protein
VAAYCRDLAVLQKQGVDPLVAQQRAADRVTLHQAERIALPRRFSQPMQEIWLLQPRFAQRQRKRVFRLLAHPRFRAAFDFLELRSHANPDLAEDVAFWREAQLQSPEHLAENAGLAPAGRGRAASGRAFRRRRAAKAPPPPSSRGRWPTGWNFRVTTGPVRVFVGLGGNVGNVETTFMEAMWAMDSLPQTSIRAQSRLYRSPPWGRTDQAESSTQSWSCRRAWRRRSCWMRCWPSRSASAAFVVRTIVGVRARSTWTCWLMARK